MAEPVTRREVALSLPLLPLNASESVRYAREAANLGYGECWIGEVGGPDAFTLAAAVLTTTPLIVGTAAVNVFTRSPMVLAMTGASLDQLSEGRFILGIGTSSETIVERWSGLPFRKPFTRMRETIPVLRDLLEGMKVSFEGEVVRLSDYRVTVPVRQPPPIYVAALGPRMLRLAGQLADGVIINLLGPEHVPVVLAEVAAGAKKVHRDPASIRVVLRVQVIPDATDEVAFVVVRSAFGPYAATGVYNQFYRWLGFTDEADRILVAWAGRDREAMAEAISDRMARAMVVNGSAEDCRARFDAYFDAGVDVIALSPLTMDPEVCWSAMRTFAPTMDRTKELA